MGFAPPPYPYDRLDALRARALEVVGEVVDCSIGTPGDPPPAAVLEALASSGTERGYPTSAGSPALRQAISTYLAERFSVEVAADQLAACVGTKEFVASCAQYLHLRDPSRDVVLHPAVAYPTYAMGATLAGLEAVAVEVDGAGRLRLDDLDPDLVDRALLLWSNSPSNPTGALDDLDAAAAWGRAAGVPVFSDECYAEFTWQGPPATILRSGLEGVVAVHSISKRSNLAGVRCGFYAGDPELVSYLRAVRQHAGLMVPGPVQAAVAVAYGDQTHVAEQRARYLARLEVLAAALTHAGIPAEVPAGTFYLWVPTPERFADDWALAAHLAEQAGLIVSPGEFYGPAGIGAIRIAVVADDAATARVASRLGEASH